MPNPPEFGSTGLDSAEDSRQRFTDEARRRGLAPISYMVVFVKNGEECFEEFECAAVQRAEYMRTQFGIDLDNDRWALKSRGSDRRWQPPIGNKDLQNVLARTKTVPKKH